MADLETLFPYQEVGATFLSAHPHALLADEMGLGKSAQVVRACDLIGATTILIVCPAAVISTGRVSSDGSARWTAPSTS